MRWLTCTLALMVPLPALALSCMQPSVTRSYVQFAAAEEAYIVVHGRLTLDETALPKGMTQSPPPPELTPVAGHLRGSALTKQGFVHPFDRDVVLEVACLGPWCGSAASGTSVLAFIRKDAEGYALEVGPCGGAVFPEPTEEQLGKVRACFRGQACGRE